MGDQDEMQKLVDAAVTEAALETGVSPDVVARRSELGQRGALILGRQATNEEGETPRRNGATWTPEEDQFVKDHLGVLSLEKIGEALGRSENAVKIRYTRKGWPAPSKQPEELTAREIGWRLGKCGKSIKTLIQREILPGRRIPGDRNIHVMKEVAFYRWAVNPAHWIYFDPDRVRDEKLQRLLARQRERWGYEWLTTGQVARMHDLPGGSNDVTRHIYAGKLTAVKYQFWRIKRSVAEAHHFRRGRGRGHERDWSEEGDAFLLLARAVGCPPRAIARLMKAPRRQPAYRLRSLHKRGLIPALIDRHRLDVEYGGTESSSPTMFADWRSVAHRFPSIQRAVDRLKAGAGLSRPQLNLLRGVLRTWAVWHADGDPAREAMAEKLAEPGAYSEARLRRDWREIRTWGVDPFE